MGYKAPSKTPKPSNIKRTINEIELKPCLYVSSTGKQYMSGTLNGEIIVDKKGKAIPFQHIKTTGIL